MESQELLQFLEVDQPVHFIELLFL